MMNKKYAALAMMGAMLVSAQAFAEGKGGIAATVNGKNITVAQIKEAYNMNPNIKSQVPFDKFYEKALDVFVDGELVYQAAVADKVTESADYQKQLKAMKEELARKVYVEQKVDKMVSEAQLKKVYEEYKASFKSQKEVKAKHILVDNEAKAKEVIAKLNKGGNFDKLAKEYSKEPADLGYFPKEAMVPEFSKAAFALKKGQYTKSPVKTQFGYHVILVEDIRDAKPQPYEKVKPQLKGMLAQGAMGKLFDDIANKAKVTKYDLKGKVIDAPVAK